MEYIFRLLYASGWTAHAFISRLKGGLYQVFLFYFTHHVANLDSTSHDIMAAGVFRPK